MNCPMRSSASSTTTSSMSAPTNLLWLPSSSSLRLPRIMGVLGMKSFLASLGVDHSMKKPSRRTARDRLIQTLQKKRHFLWRSNPVIANMPDRTPPISESPCKMPDAVDSYQDDFQESLFASSGNTRCGWFRCVPRRSLVALKFQNCLLSSLNMFVIMSSKFRVNSHFVLGTTKRWSADMLFWCRWEVCHSALQLSPGNTPFLLSNTFLKGDSSCNWHRPRDTLE